MLAAENFKTVKNVLKTFVGGLPYHCHEDELRQFLEQFGSIEQIYISKDAEGQHKGFAFVSFYYLYPTLQLFGEHSFKSKTIEVKLNLLNHLIIPSLPPFVSSEDIYQTIESLGFPVARVIVGSGMNGVPADSASVKLVDDFHLNGLGHIGKLIIKGASILMEAKINKYLPAQILVKGSLGGRKHSKRLATQFSSDKKGKFYRQDLLPSNCGDTLFQEHNLLNSALMKSATQTGESEISTADTVGIGAFSNSPKVKKELPPSSLSFSKVSMLDDSPHDLFEFPKLDLFPRTTIAKVSTDMTLLLFPAVRHHSECIADNQFDHRSSPRRLSNFSSSFHTHPVLKSRSSSLVVVPEIKIGFFTYPGRD